MPTIVVVASNLSSGSGASVIFFLTGSPDRVSALSGRTTKGAYPAGYPRRSAGRADHHVPVSRCLSAAGISLLGHPIPAGGLGLPHGRLTEPESGPRRGYR